MIKCNLWLMGGLGNALFQFFFGRVLRDHGFEVHLIEALVKSSYLTRAAKWSIHAPIYKRLTDEPLSDHSVFPALMAFVLKEIGLDSRQFLFYKKIQDIKKITNNSHVFGYFQDPEIFSNNLDLFHSFCDELSKKLNLDQSIEQVAHFRFGDHLSDKKWIGDNLPFHEKARDLIINSSKRTMIVTDSVDYCRAFFGNSDNLVFSTAGEAFDDFRTLCSAKTLILSPSTFSWWAAHIGRAVEHVYMPEALYSQLRLYRSNCKLDIL